MKTFYIVETATRKILRRGSCTDRDLRYQARSGEEIHEGVIGNETHLIDGVPMIIPSPPPTPEEIAAADDRSFSSVAIGKIAKAFFNHENRLRILEGKPSVTWEQFKTAIRGLA